MGENPTFFRHFRRESVIRIVSVIYKSNHAFGTYTAWLEVHVDMGRVCATIKDSDGEPLVSFIKLVSSTVRRRQRTTR